MKTNILLFMAWSLCCAFFGQHATFATENPETEQQFEKAFELLVSADKARDIGETDNAVILYKDALEAYTKFAANHPQWKPSLTKFRTRYCKTQIQSLNRTGKVIPAEESLANKVTEKNNKIMLPPKSNININRDQKNKDAFNLIKNNQLDEAYRVLLKNLQTEPDNRRTRLLLGILHCRKKQYENAVHILLPLLEEDTKNTSAGIALAAAYFGKGYIKKAENWLQIVILTNKSIPEAHYNMARVKLAKEKPDTDAARKHYRKSLDLGGSEDKTLNTLLNPH